MSYDIQLNNPVTGRVLMLCLPHHIPGCTVQIHGTRQARLSVTYNYTPIFNRVFDGGILSLSGMTGDRSILALRAAISKLDNNEDKDYWKPTEGNAKRVLFGLMFLAIMEP